MASTTRQDFGANTPAKDVAREFATQINGKTILITGVNREGIGFVTAQALASQTPCRLILAGRSESKVQICIDALRSESPNVDYRFLQIDLSSQASARAAAQAVLGWADVPKIDVLINSAGVMGTQERTLTEDGIEMHFATNHIGHWLFTCLIMPKLLAAARDQPKGTVRIVNVSSASPKTSAMRWSDINFEKPNKSLPSAEQPKYDWLSIWGHENARESSYIPIDAYDRSKVANLLFSVEANIRLFNQHGVLSATVHPGVLMTDLGRSFPPETMEQIQKFLAAGTFTMKPIEAGGSTSLVAALDPGLASGVGQSRNGCENWGTYLDDCQISGQAQPLAISGEEAEKLWALSEKLTREHFEW